MNAVVNSVLIDWAKTGWCFLPLRRVLPPRGQRLTVLFPVLAGVVGLLWAGGFVLLANRGLYGQWSVQAFVVAGLFGLFAGLVAGAMVWIAWNQDAASLGRLSASGHPWPEAARPSRARRWTLRPLLFGLTAFTALVLTTGVENWRGSRALEAFRAGLRARSEPVVLADVVPPPVPDEQNLAMAPLFRPLMEYEYVTNPRGLNGVTLAFRDTNGIARLNALSLEPGLEAFARKEKWREQSWWDGGRVDVRMWQGYFKSLPGSPPSSESQSAARDVLQGTTRWDPELKALHAAAAERPELRFPLHYEEGFLCVANHLAPLKQICSILRIRASALLAVGQPDEALKDLRLGFRLSDGLRKEPLLISQLVRMSIDAKLLDPIWAGCADHHWKDPQLAALQEILAQRNYLEDMRVTLRGERVMGDIAFDGMIRGNANAIPGGAPGGNDSIPRVFLKLMNRGWIEQNRVAYGRYVDAVVQDLGTTPVATAMPREDQRRDAIVGKRSIFTILAAMLAPALNPSVDRAFEAEARRRLAMVGLGLERARVRDGVYPADLGALQSLGVPGGTVVDPMDGRPLRYARTSDGDYHLYSVGLNGRDDGGVRPEKKGARSSETRMAGDIVWR